MGPDDKVEDQESLDLDLEKFRNYLHTSDRYDTKTALVRMSDSWMIQEQVMLYCKQNQIKKALEIFLTKERFQDAENFCTERENGQKLFTVLFEIYLERYALRKARRESCEPGSAQYKEAQIEEGRFKQIVLDLLKKHGSKDGFDTVRALKLIPDDWPAWEADQFNLLRFL